MRHNGAYKDLTGRQFGNWLVVKLLPHRAQKRKRSVWLVRCICGTEAVKLGQNLLRGKNTGCGCVGKHGKKPFETLYTLLLHIAKGRVDCALTYDQFIEFTKQSKCHYCGAPLNWKPYFANAQGYKLDRKDNNIGYTKDNCVVCCPRCNRAKSDHFTYEEWLQIGSLIRGWAK